MKILTMLLVTSLMFTFTVPCFANSGMLKPGDIESQVNYEGSNNQDMLKITGKVIGLIRNAAVIAGVILLSILGIKYMMGSAEEKAGYQKSFVPLIIGIIVVMAASQIASMIFGIFAK